MKFLFFVLALLLSSVTVLGFNLSNSEFVLVKSEFGTVINLSNSDFKFHSQLMYGPVFNSSNSDFFVCVGFYCINPRGISVVKPVGGNVWVNGPGSVLQCPSVAPFRVLYEGRVFCASKETIERFKWQRFILYFSVTSGLVLFLFFKRRKKRRDGEKVLNTSSSFRV